MPALDGGDMMAAELHEGGLLVEMQHGDREPGDEGAQGHPAKSRHAFRHPSLGVEDALDRLDRLVLFPAVSQRKGKEIEGFRLLYIIDIPTYIPVPKRAGPTLLVLKDVFI